MTEQVAETKWIGALEHNQPVATRLGLYLAQMTAFELTITGMFRNLTGITTTNMAEQIFGRIMSIATRIEINEALCEVCPNRPFAEACAKLIATAKEINQRRNEHVHGTYRITESSGRVELITWVTSEGRKSKNYEITVESIDAEILKIRTFIGDYMTALGITLEPIAAAPPMQ